MKCCGNSGSPCRSKDAGSKDAGSCVTGPKAKAAECDQRQVAEDRRQSAVDRRNGLERRQQSAAEAGYESAERRIAQRRASTGLERRRGPGRRLSDDRRAAEEGEMTTEQFEFVMAIETYKKVNKRMYPTWTEILEIVQQLGYRKVAQRDVHLENVPEPTICKVA